MEGKTRGDRRETGSSRQLSLSLSASPARGRPDRAAASADSFIAAEG